MFENEIAINRFQLGLFDKIVADLTEADLYRQSPGHGHPPVWIMGHLALTGEFGQKLLGGRVTHPEWAPLFGPGSSDKVGPIEGASMRTFADAVREAYDGLRMLAGRADAAAMSAPHAIENFLGSPIATVGHVVSLLLTSHFGMHSSQLSSCRRSAGFAKLF